MSFHRCHIDIYTWNWKKKKWEEYQWVSTTMTLNDNDSVLSQRKKKTKQKLSNHHWIHAYLSIYIRLNELDIWIHGFCAECMWHRAAPSFCGMNVPALFRNSFIFIYFCWANTRKTKKTTMKYERRMQIANAKIYSTLAGIIFCNGTDTIWMTLFVEHVCKDCK